MRGRAACRYGRISFFFSLVVGVSYILQFAKSTSACGRSSQSVAGAGCKGLLEERGP